MVERSIRVALVLILAGATFAAHRAMSIRSWEERDERFVPRPQVARAVSLGFDAVVADFYWLQAVQVVGGSRGSPSRHAPLLGRLVDVTTSVNPWVGHPYRFAAVWLTESPESVRQANRLLERGVAHHPSDWRNRFYLGFNHFFYLGDNEAAARVLESAADLPGAPAYLRRLIARLRADTDGLDAAAVFLEQLRRETQDPYARADYEKALDEIETERRARFLDRARAEYRQRHGRDLEQVEDLLRGPDPVLRELPPELHGWEWILDRDIDKIVSSYYGHRYQLHFQDEVARWKRKRRERVQASEERL